MLGATVGFEHLSLSVSLVAAFTNGLIYVLSLYIWNSKYKRSDPIVIKKKFLSVKLASIASILFVYLLSRPKSSGYRFHELIGLKIEGVFLSICVALLSTCILFSGPIVQNTTYNFIYYENKSGSCRTFTKFFFFLNEQLRENFSWNSLRHVTWWRNYVVSPITEELVFRACLLPLVYNQLKFTNSILISPSFFGLGKVFTLTSLKNINLLKFLSKFSSFASHIRRLSKRRTTEAPH
jgi:prenyl protein peptidase